jgi:hypothetical protein
VAGNPLAHFGRAAQVGKKHSDVDFGPALAEPFVAAHA